VRLRSDATEKGATEMDWWERFALPASGITDRERAQLVMALTMRLSLAATVFGMVVLALAICGPACPGQARAIGLLLSLGALVSAGGVGFLFGIPKTVQADEKNARLSYQVNTNLEQISDWLTKMIVGLALVNLKTVPARIADIGSVAGASLGPNGNIIAQVVVVYFGGLGFLYGYLATRLYLAPSFPYADRVSYDALSDAVAPTINALSTADKLQPPRDVTPPAPPAPVQRLARTAAQARPPASDMPLPVARNTALALYLSGRYAEAVPYFDRADERPEDDPRFAIQHAITLGESGSQERAVQVLERVVNITDTPVEAKKALGYYLLWLPNRIQDSIKYTQEYLDSVKDDDGAIFNLACAYAQRYGQTKDQKDLDRAEAELKRAISMNPAWKQRAKELRNDDLASIPEERFAAIMKQ
jgi:tetratricopeptide (TPR) repeat protein